MNADQFAHDLADTLSANPALDWLADATPTEQTERELFKVCEDWFHVVLARNLSVQSGTSSPNPHREPEGWRHVADEVEMAVGGKNWPETASLATVHKAWFAQRCPGVGLPKTLKDGPAILGPPFKAASCDMLLARPGEVVWLELKQIQHGLLKGNANLGIVDDVRKLGALHIGATTARWDRRLMESQGLLPKRGADREKFSRVSETLGDRTASWWSAAVAVCWLGSDSEDPMSFKTRVDGALGEALRHAAERDALDGWTASDVAVIRKSGGAGPRFGLIACVKDLERHSAG